MDNREVKLLKQNVYGTERLFPNNSNAEQFAKLLGTKCIAEKFISNIEALGFIVTITKG